MIKDFHPCCTHDPSTSLHLISIEMLMLVYIKIKITFEPLPVPAPTDVVFFCNDITV